MAYQAVFKRYEVKYMLTRQQKDILLKAMEPYMKQDSYGHTTIRNIYFDTDNYRLVRRSIEKPIYKEKLRIRSYKKADAKDKVFIELKKKYDSVVYKRREALEQEKTIKWLEDKGHFPLDTQIGREIDYFFGYYKTLKPKMFVSYEREAFFSLDGSDFRVTFDENIMARQEELSLSGDVWGTKLIGDDQVLMEIKVSGGIPMWMVHALTDNRIYSTSFSKYGTAYRKIVCADGAESLQLRKIG